MTRQELYDEIKKTSKDSYILSEMKRLGFWDSAKPKVAQELIEKKTALQKELNGLSTKIRNPEAVIKDIHKQRMADALLRREETKAKKEKIFQENLAKRQEKKNSELGFIGHAFMADLDEKESNQKLLNENNLFLIKDAKDLASKMGITLKELRFLTHTQKLSNRTDYVHFKMVKKSGGFREISAPKPQLKRLQYWILENILNKVAVSNEAHGFVAKRSIVSNAKPHLQKALVINCDLENFFPTLSYARVKGLFKSLGYSVELATILAILTTEAEQKEVLLDGEKLYLYTGKRYLPQGSPASPMITNLICRKLDKRMSGISKSLDFNYTRYADDMTFSSDTYLNINKMMFWIKGIVKEEGFILHPKKTKIMKKGARHEVTGIVVNEKLSVNRKNLKKFRALLYQIEESGLEGKRWQGKSENLMASVWGYANFINMVDPEKGAKYKKQVEVLLEKYPLGNLGSSSGEFRAKSAKGEQPWESKVQEIEAKTLEPEMQVKEVAEQKETPSFVNNILSMFRK
ncbi:MAG: Retron-type RNA-directed DNA polymerase (EC [uncultured Sulfurovum sp.]|uniref:RNA-directed DNA polymerase n=1 Tax=uncultured Sulfurovum sp. TaxID=269237 RepID=A0A6S6T0C7_9BACT|nr:MAG: Retron-type RNA-directed DNA polymerase (EC [uncultured Sulfurovum sp.]